MIKRVSKRHTKKEVLKHMLPLVREWFDSKFDELTAPQAYAVPVIHRRESVLISSPTGSGKTLTAFLSIINELLIKQEKGELEDKIYCVYVSPLKALANDIDKNLKQPLKELTLLANEKGLAKPKIRVAVRSGDTTSYERQKMARKPPHILITTPESLAIILTTPKFSLALHSAEYLIVDEIHEICSNKRGVQLSVNLERLQGRLDATPARIGLSATQAPIDEMAKFLSGYDGRKQRDVYIVEVDTGKEVELKVITPVEDMTALPFEIVNARMYQRLKEIIDANTTTLVFTNTRSGTEAVMVRLADLGLKDIAAHHGSLSRETRLDVEDRLKGGELKAVVSSTSLELGIDIGSIDMMCQIGSPKSIAKGLQRVGRSGHGYGEVSRGRFIAFDNDDLVECAVLAKKAEENFIDRVDLPRNSLDVLAQTLVGMSIERKWDSDEAFRLIRNSYSYHTLSKDDYTATLAYLSSRDMPHVYSKLWFDESENVFGRKRGSRLIYYLNSGTIPEEANYKVYADAAGKLGELSEGFVEKLSPGDVFVLGGSAYEFTRAKGMSLFVKPATGKRPTVPSWTGEMLPRSFDLSVEIGRFRSDVAKLISKGGDVHEYLLDYGLDEGGARSIESYFREQVEFNGLVPTEKNLVIEGYVDPKHNLNLVFHYCFGRRTNDALARAYAMAVSNAHKCNVSVSVNDDCFMLTLPKHIPLEGLDKLVAADNVVPLLEEAVKGTELFRHRFRHCSTRGFMVLRNYRGREITVGKQHQRSQKVLKALGSRQDFPIIRETVNEIMGQNMDIASAKSVLESIGAGKIEVAVAGVTDVPSPFAHNVVLVGMSDIVLMHDRSTLLKELHRKVLMRVGGKDTLKPEFEAEKVREYYAAKRPVVESKDDVERVLREVGTLDLFSTKGYNIYDLTELPEKTVADWCRESVEEGAVVSVWTGRTAWASSSELENLAYVYAPTIAPGEREKAVIAHLKGNPGSTAVSIAKALDAEPKAISQDLRSLERAFMVARSGHDSKNTVLWSHRSVKPKASKAFERKMVERHVAHFGPLTVDEISYDLGLTKERVLKVINQLEDKGQVASGAFTEPSLQYMLSGDRVGLMEGEGTVTGLQVRFYHLQKHFKPVETLDEYFDRYMVVWMPQDLLLRGNRDVMREWRQRRKAGDILHGRFMDGNVCYVRREDVPDFVNAYRSAEPGELGKQLLRIIERQPGIDIAGIAKEAELPKGKLKSGVEELDRNMFIIRQYTEREGWSTWNRYELLDAGFEPGLRDESAERVTLRTLKAHGPIPLRSLAYATGFSMGRVKEILDGCIERGDVALIRTAEDNRTLYIWAEETPVLHGGLEGDDELRILTLYDPFVQHYRFELRRRFGDAWYYPIFKGTELVGTMEMWEMSGCMDVRDVGLDDDSLLPDFLDRLDEFSAFYAENYMDVIRVKGILGKEVSELDPSTLNVFGEKGYARVGDWLVKGAVETFDISESQLISYLLWKQHVLPETNFDGMEDGLTEMSGFRSDDEALSRCRRTVPLKRLHRSRIVEMGQLIPKLLTYALPDDIMLFKAAMAVESDRYMEMLMAMFREEGEMKWRQVLDRSPLGYKNTLEVKGKLTSALMVLRNHANEFYLTPPTPFTREEARKEVVRRLFRQFGIFSAERLAVYTKGEYRMPEIRRILRELEDEGLLVKGYLLSGSDKLHWMVKKDIRKIRDGPADIEVLLTSSDRLVAYLLPWVHEKLHTGTSWILISEGDIIAAARVRRKKSELVVQEVVGDDRIRNAIKQYSLTVGKRLRREEVGEAEDYQDWYEKHMLPQK